MANEYLKRTPTSTGNRKVFTWSVWVKRNELGTNQNLLCSTAPGIISKLLFDTNDKLQYQNNSPSFFNLITNQSFRDVGSWIHILFVSDTTNSTSSDRIKLYVNGSRITDFSTETYPAINSELIWNQTIGHWISNESSNVNYFDGEWFDIFHIDGQALTPDVFGYYKKGDGYISAGSTQATDFKKGQWVPKAPKVIKSVINARGGFGVNGFYLPMNDASNFGADFHCEPNSIIKLKGEDFNEYPQPRNGAPETTDAYVSQLREDPYAANLVLAVPGISGGQGSGYGDYSADIKGSGSNKTLTSNGNAGVAATASYYGSALSFDGSGDYFSTTSGASDFDLGTDDFTIEGWVYPESFSNFPTLIKISNTTASSDLYINFRNSSTLALTNNTTVFAGSSGFVLNQWNHFALVRSSGSTTMYGNGVAGGPVTCSIDFGASFTGTTIGSGSGGNDPFTGYLQDLRVYKGVAKYKGGFDVPKPYTPVGIESWRAVPDTTANNFATWNPISPASNTTYTNGNLTVTYGSSSTRGVVIGTVGIAVTGAGKYYWENRIDVSSTSPPSSMIGVWGMSTTVDNAKWPGFTNNYGWSYYGTGRLYYSTGDSYSNPLYGDTYTTGDIISVSLDMTTNNGTLTFYKNGVSQGVATTGLGTFLTNGNIHALMPALGDGSGVETYTLSTNFGQNPTFSGNTTAGTYTDSNGKGLFKYEPPSGFLALCEDNLPTPAIKNPGEYFKTVLYTGDGNNGHSITGVGFQPDLVWIKIRNQFSGYNWNHLLQDSVRGAGNTKLFSNSTSQEGTQGDYGYLSSFDSNGFSITKTGTGSYDYAQTNASGGTYVAWCWRAGAGTTSTNTDGSIQSVVSVNQDAGFSIVSYTGNATESTVGHGLNKTPGFIIVKKRNGAADWPVYHQSLATQEYLVLNLTNAKNTTTVLFYQDPTSSVFYIGDASNAINASGGTYIAYCWAEVEGFSKFGSYVGNGDPDGPFVYCGFKPAFVLLKIASPAGQERDWHIYDSARNSTNIVGLNLRPSSSASEYDEPGIDFLSNGFKIRGNYVFSNYSGGTYIFTAFAESPFTTANAK